MLSVWQSNGTDTAADTKVHRKARPLADDDDDIPMLKISQHKSIHLIEYPQSLAHHCEENRTLEASPSSDILAKSMPALQEGFAGCIQEQSCEDRGVSHSLCLGNMSLFNNLDAGSSTVIMVKHGRRFSGVNPSIGHGNQLFQLSDPYLAVHITSSCQQCTCILPCANCLHARLLRQPW